MAELTFDELDSEIMRLYDAGNYAQVYDLVVREAGRFPEHADELYYIRMCMAGRLDDIPLALQYFRDALVQGYWFAPRWLHDDEDLKPLQGLPEFEEMVSICQQRLEAAQVDVKPELTVLLPEGEQRSGQYPLFIALHGNGANAPRNIGPNRWVTSQGWILAVPQSSQIIGPNSFVWDDWDKSKVEVQQHLATLNRDYKIDSEQIVLSGFSMGAGLATWLSVSGAIKTRGFVVLGPYLRDVDILLPLLDSAKVAGVRGYIIIGEEDKACRDIAHKVHEMLKEYGIPCELELRPGLGHVYPDDYTKSLEKGLAFVLGG